MINNSLSAAHWTEDLGMHFIHLRNQPTLPTIRPKGGFANRYVHTQALKQGTGKHLLSPD